ncbi:hypothetical protein D3C76_1136650 [compost metagenome]
MIPAIHALMHLTLKTRSTVWQKRSSAGPLFAIDSGEFIGTLASKLVGQVDLICGQNIYCVMASAVKHVKAVGTLVDAPKHQGRIQRD